MCVYACVCKLLKIRGGKKKNTTPLMGLEGGVTDSHGGGGDGNPFHCSCLKNPRDSGAWEAAVYGVAQSWTRLKGLSSSSSN